MKSEEEIKARIELYRETRTYADECVDTAEGSSPRAYWEQRVAALTTQIWELEWVMS